MIPYLKNSKEASISGPLDIEKRKPDEESEFDGLEACMEELGNALAAKDHKAAAAAFRAAFELSELEPHEEGPHLG
jgi:hypothetical protein